MPEDVARERAERRTTPDDLAASTQKWMWSGLVLMALFFLAFPVFRFYEPSQRADARESQQAFLAATGEELYDASCASCHGVAGTGAIAPAIGAREFLEAVDDSQIAQLIAVGVPGSEMVAYSNDIGGPMTAQEIDAITAYLRSLEEDAVSKPNWRTPLVDENLTTNNLYVLACSRCHATDTRGIEDVAPDLSVTAIAQDESEEFWLARISEGYKSMPRFDGILSDAQIAELVAFLRVGPPTSTTTTTAAPQDGATTTTSPTGGTTTTSAAPDPSTDEELAIGQVLWDVTAGAGGCQECHGLEGYGTPSGPNIIGASKSSLTKALGGNEDMDFNPKLTQAEIDAVYAYMQYLTQLANS